MNPAWVTRTGRALARALGAVLLPLAIGAGLLASAVEVSAQSVRPYSIRYQTNTNGDIAQVGNMNMTCVASAACTNAQSGIGANLNNNDYTMTYVDVDGDAFGPTFNSSSADLNMPAGASVVFAGLYWGGISAVAARSQMLLKTPGTGGYTAVTANQLDSSNITVANNYSAFADVTSLVQSGGNGTYWGANIQSDNSGVINAWGGWCLVIVYQSNTKALRNLVVFDGYANVDNANPLTFTLSGFLTPYSGPVVTQVGTFGFDGDRTFTGDTLQVRSSTSPTFTTISDANNPANNFYNSTVSDGGVNIVTRNPAFTNTLGIDIDRFTLPTGIVGNGATAADILVTTGGEQYLPAVVTWATDLYVPVITPNLVKTATDLNGGSLLPGDVIRWDISMSNTGLDSGVNLIMRDGVPANTTYVPGSAYIRAGANSSPTAKTDTIGDDQVDYQTLAAQCNPAPAPCLIFRLGTGANAVSGGTLAFGESTALSFNVTVNANVTAGTQIANTAYISYNGQTLTGVAFAASSAATSSTVSGPPVLAKSFNPTFIGPGGTSQLKVTVTNPAGNGSTLTNVTFNDGPYPANLTNSGTPAPSLVCTAGATQGVISGGAAAGNSIGMSGTSLPPGASCDLTVNVTSAVAGSYVNTTSTVTATEVATAGAAASATLAVGKLALTKTFSPSTIRAGQVASLSVTVFNPGNVVTGAAFIDAFPAGLVIAGAPFGPFPNPPCGAANAALGSANSVLQDSGGGALGAGDVGIGLPSGATGGTIATASSCTFAVNVTGATATTFGLFDNTTGGATRSGDGVAGSPSNTARLTIVGSPVVTKTLTPPIINSGDTTQVSITLSNPNTTTTITRAATAFTDTYPLAFVNTNPANVTINCSGGSSAAVVGGVAGGATIGMSNVSLAPSGSCTITSLVTGTSGTVPTSGVNTVGVVTFDNAPATSGASASYTITNVVEPTITKTFANAAVSAGAGVVMTITLTNSNASAITGASFTDTFPFGMVNTTGSATIAPAGCTPGTATVTSSALTLSGLTIPSTSSCTITTQVSASSTGAYFNSTGRVTTTNTPAQNTAGTAALAAYKGLDVTKDFGSSAIAVGTGTTTLTLTITNPSGNPGVISASSIIDAFPAGIQVATGGTGAVNAGCVASGTSVFDDNVSGGIAVNIGNGDTAIRLQNYSVAIGTPCIITISAVRMVTAGVLINTVGTVQSTRAQQGAFPATLNGTGGSAQLSAGKVGISKAFSPAAINVGGTSTVTFTLNNTSALAVSGIAFSDLLTNSSPTTRQLTLASGTVGGTCTGVVSNAAAGGTSFVVTAGNVPAASTCTITIQVTSAVSGINSNQTTGVTHAADPVPSPVSNIATLTVNPPPVVTKSFLPSEVGPGLRSTLSVSVTNTNNFAIDVSALTDVFPAGLLAASPLITSNGCGGTLRNPGDTANLAAGGTGFLLKNGTVATNSSCVIAISVSAATAGSYVNTIAAGALTSDAGSNVNPASATLTVLSPLTVVKTFTPNSIAAGGTSILQVRLTNPNSVAVTGAGFTDTYPANLNNTVSPAGATSCPGGAVTAASGGTSLALSGATVPANNFCDVTVNVTSAVSGVRTNPAFGVATTNAGTTTSATATLSVGVPAMTKTFSPNPVGAGAVSTISFVITNPTGSPMNNVGFTDTFPAGMTLAYAATTPQCGGTLYLADGTTTPPSANGGSVRLGSSTGTTGGSIATSGSCTIAVAVTTSSSGVRVNTTGPVTAGASVGNTATDTLTTLAPPVPSKSFAPSTVGANQTSVLTVRIDNPNAFVIAGVAFTDSYPATLVNAAAPAGATTCGGTPVVTATAGVASLGLSGATIPASSFCVVTVNVIASTSGTLVNSLPSGTVTSTNAGSSTVAAAATLLVLPPPVVQKDFIGPNYASFGLTGTTMPLNTPTVMRIRFTNSTGSAAITGVSLNDNYPAGLINSTPPNETIAGAGCTGSLTVAAGGTSLGLLGMTIPPSTTCTVTVQVQSAVSNFYTNSTGPISTGNAGTGVATSGSIYVMAPLSVAKSFTPSFIVNPPGTATSSMQVTLVNPNPYPVTGTAITDNYDSNPPILNQALPAATFTGAGCSGTATAAGGFAVMNLANGTVPTSGTCVVNVAISLSGVANGTFINCTDSITTANAGTAGNVCASITRGAAPTTQPPVIAKSFLTTPVAVGAVSTLSFTITNPNTGIITSTAFVDNLPAGLVVATPAITTNNCGPGTWNATAGSSVLNLSGGTVTAGASCVVSVEVTGNTSGIYTNTSGTVSARALGVLVTGNQATAVLTILDPPDITKAFTPAIINQGGVSTISFVISNNNGSAVTSVAFTDTLTNMTIVNPPAAVVTGTGCSGFTINAPNGGSLISVSGGSVPARVGVTPGTCTVTLQVTSIVAGVWPNATSQITSSAGTGASSNSATLTVNQVTVGVSGYVFGDLNANGVRNPLTEDWSAGVLVYVNIVSGGAVVQSQAVNVGTGFFNFPAVPYGNYTIIVSDNPGNITPVIPAGFSATQPTGASWNLPINGGVPPVVDFGFTLPALSRVSGRVFRDSGLGGGTANNGILDAGEGGSSPGIAGVPVAVTNCAGTTFATTTTDGNGFYLLNFPSTATNVCIIETNPGNNAGSASSGAPNPGGIAYLSTGASSAGAAITASTCAAPPGGGAVEYDRATDRICFLKSGGSYVNYSNLNFGDVPINTFVPDGAQQTTPGSVLLYPHVFTFETSGTVTFGATVVATNPANYPGWSEILYRDADCNGNIDAADTILTTATVVPITSANPPANKICVVLRENVPPAAPFGSQRVVRIDANFIYTNASPGLSATYTRNDTTTVEDKSSATIKLVKEVCNETTAVCTDSLIDQSSLAGNGNYATNNTAKAGDVLRYRIIYTNLGGTVAGGGVSNLVIRDATPPFTTLVGGSLACIVTPPAPATCTPLTAPPLGVQWTIGSVSGGGQGIVLYKVSVQ